MKQVTVMGIAYGIIQVSPSVVIASFKDSPHLANVKELVGAEGENFAGLCDAQKCIIYIFNGLPDDKKRKTLIHEMIEAVDQEALLNLEHYRIQELTNLLFIGEPLDLSDTKLQTIVVAFERAGVWTSNLTFSFANKLYITGKVNVERLLEDDTNSVVEVAVGDNQRNS